VKSPKPDFESTDFMFNRIDLSGIDSTMAEATRLTRAGRLSEATALLRRNAGIAAGTTEAAKPGFDVIDLVAEPVQPTTPAREPTAAAGSGRMVAGSFTCPAGSRAFKLYVPGHHHATPMPLVVMLHGCTQTADDFAAGTAMNQLAETQGFVVAYPEQSQAANANRCWNWFEPAHQHRGSGEPSIIAGLTHQIMRDHPIDPARVYVAGLSAGGAAAAVMGAAYPDLYAAVGVHSGLALGSASNLISALAAMQGRGGAVAAHGHAVPTIVFHGDADSTVHPANGDAVIAAASAKGLTVLVEPRHHARGRDCTRMTGTTGDGRLVIEQWTIHGAGHAWSGGNARGTYTDPRGPSATDEMIRFFLTHRLVVSQVVV